MFIDAVEGSNGQRIADSSFIVARQVSIRSRQFCGSARSWFQFHFHRVVSAGLRCVVMLVRLNKLRISRRMGDALRSSDYTLPHPTAATSIEILDQIDIVALGIC
jgi:hypothetical protein